MDYVPKYNLNDHCVIGYFKPVSVISKIKFILFNIAKERDRVVLN